MCSGTTGYVEYTVLIIWMQEEEEERFSYDNDVSVNLISKYIYFYT